MWPVEWSTAGRIANAIVNRPSPEPGDLDISEKYIAATCRRMVRDGRLLSGMHGFALPLERYAVRPDGMLYELVRIDPGSDIVIIIGRMSHEEALVCSTSLNEHDRKVRALRQGGNP
jgi:hypothetical protein